MRSALWQILGAGAVRLAGVHEVKLRHAARAELPVERAAVIGDPRQRLREAVNVSRGHGAPVPRRDDMPGDLLAIERTKPR